VAFCTNINGMERSAERAKKMHATVTVPYVANFYNDSKNGVDACDHLIENISHDHR